MKQTGDRTVYAGRDSWKHSREWGKKIVAYSGMGVVCGRQWGSVPWEPL